MNSIGKHFLALTLSILICGCQSLFKSQEISVPISKGLSLRLPERLFLPRHVSQLLSFTKGSQRHTFQVVLKQSQQAGLKIAAFDLLGTPIFELAYGSNCKEPGPAKGTNCSQASLQVFSGPAYKMFATRILRDLYLIYGDSQQLQERLPPGVTLYTSLQERQLRLHGTKILVIKYRGIEKWKGPVSYENFEENYSLKIKNLPMETL